MWRSLQPFVLIKPAPQFCWACNDVKSAFLSAAWLSVPDRVLGNVVHLYQLNLYATVIAPFAASKKRAAIISMKPAQMILA
jgi:hypothetical protein